MKASETDTAIYVIFRNSGEGADRNNAEGDYLPFPEEMVMNIIQRVFMSDIVILILLV